MLVNKIFSLAYFDVTEQWTIKSDSPQNPSRFTETLGGPCGQNKFIEKKVK